MKIFIDMDGTIAKFYEKPNYLERMYEKNFFRNLKPYALARTVNALAGAGYDVYVLSACVNTSYCKQEKLEWCKQYLPNLNPDNIILLGVGENKARKIDAFIGWDEYAILVDDYGLNLEQWTIRPNYVAIKRKNEINCTKGKEYALEIKNGGQLLRIVEEYAEKEKHFIKDEE